ncbi:MAG: antibiotic biosynthesis monooxygenase [Solirubrobacteraceae bacterium MAG38_C4-C5]|nr:antibiotic biosynthesis monooxygenase [Candidatus Siliceabacter maunaloa]
MSLQTDKRPSDRIAVRDERAGAVIATVWTLPARAAQDEAADAALAAVSAEPGLVRTSVFTGVDDPTVLHRSQWVDAATRDAFIARGDARRRSGVDADVPGATPDWQMSASLYRSFVPDGDAAAACLVVVRQPLQRPDAAQQRSWVDTVITALESDTAPAPGLRAASFFASADGKHVLNLAEWADADAHRSALRPVDFGRGVSLGTSPQWRAARSHPGVCPEHEVRRYELFGACEFLR